MPPKDKDFGETIEKLSAFVEASGNLPNKRSPDENEKKLGYFLNVLRGKGDQLSKDQKAKVLQIPGMSERMGPYWDGSRNDDQPVQPVALPPPDVSEEVLPPDAPPDHEAYENCIIHKDCAGMTVVRFNHKRDDTKISCQIAVKKVGSLEIAERICRACFVKWAEGASVEEVLAYRQECYNKVRSVLNLPKFGKQTRATSTSKPNRGKEKEADAQEGEANDMPAQPRKRRRVSNNANAESPVVEDEDRQKAVDDKPADPVVREEDHQKAVVDNPPVPEGAVHILGRAADAKNAAINGTYLPVQDGFEGKPAYAKMTDGTCRHFLYYMAGTQRWIIGTFIGDAARGYAYLKASDANTGPYHGTWTVFGGKEAGYSEDAAVRCVSSSNNPRLADVHIVDGQPQEQLLTRHETNGSTCDKSNFNASGSESGCESGESDAPEESNTKAEVKAGSIVTTLHGKSAMLHMLHLNGTKVFVEPPFQVMRVGKGSMLNQLCVRDRPPGPGCRFGWIILAEVQQCLGDEHLEQFNKRALGA